MNTQDHPLPSDYTQWLSQIKQQVSQARQRAVLAVNTELVCLYWQIGQEILQRQAQQGWGSKVIDRLGRDLREAFPDMKGFSRANLMYMRAFAETWTDFEFVQQTVGQLPWGHNILIINKLKSADERLFYVQKALSEHWSRTTLEVQVKNKLYERQGKAVTNFNKRLPDTYANLAQESLKDPYLFDFLGLGEDAQERDIEDALVRHVTRFLLELGSGFAYIGRQYRLEVNGDEFFIDLLFYHTRLKSYVVVELKATAFKPEHAGQLNFYLAAVDAQIKADDDNPTIGLLLCRTQNRLVAEYALSGIDKPIGVAEYALVRNLPEDLQSSLPTVGQLEAELGDFRNGE
ncbi:YhcG family protein [Lonepinella sp. MS14437]|uniref:PDDEXK nuclease domain-containing protein n=1 Tax=Lonepinella sp. MS14437 TaxID=3003620 RepID=UPI0036DB5402